MEDNHPYTVRMLDTQTGEERDAGPYDFPFSHFWWTEGNFGCGCNRQAEWHRADPTFVEEECVDIDAHFDPERDEWVEEEIRHPVLGSLFGECTSNRYSALYATLVDGSIIYIDQDDPETCTGE